MTDYRLLASLTSSAKLRLLLDFAGLAGLFLLIFDPNLTNVSLNTSLNASLIFISYLAFLLNLISGMLIGQKTRKFFFLALDGFCHNWPLSVG